MIFLDKMIKAVTLYKYVRMIVESRNVLAQGKPDMAEDLFEKGEIGFNKLPIDFVVLKGQIKFDLRKNAESYDLFSQALDLVNASDNVPKNDKLYLESYICKRLNFYNKFFRYGVEIKEVDCNDFDLSKVREDWKRWFPLASHPDWGKNGE